MKNKVKIIISSFLFLIAICAIVFNCVNDKTYSYGLEKKVVNSSGKITLEYYDATTGIKLSLSDAKKYYGIISYDIGFSDGNTYYFKDCSQISQTDYNKGISSIDADERCKEYGDGCIRVKTTQSFKNELDSIFTNKKIGEWVFVYSPTEDINFSEVNAYFKSKYGVENAYQNVYKYEKKGIVEPYRFPDEIVADYGEYRLLTTTIRISKDQEQVLENFWSRVGSIFAGNGTDFDKIQRAYRYLISTNIYYDNGIHTNLSEGFTSAYAGLILQKTPCIGYADTFAYMMDKLGVEAYVIDQITQINESQKYFFSEHSYNIVKLDGKYYGIDPTNRFFLFALNQSEIHASFINKNLIATSAYGVSYNDDILSQKATINAAIEAAKQTATNKTTAHVLKYNEVATTAAPMEIPGTTAPATTKKTTTTTTAKSISTTTGKQTVTTNNMQIKTTTSVITNENGHTLQVITERPTTTRIITNKDGNVVYVLTEEPTTTKKITNKKGVVVQILTQGTTTTKLITNENGEILQVITNRPTTSKVITNKQGEVIAVITERTKETTTKTVTNSKGEIVEVITDSPDEIKENDEKISNIKDIYSNITNSEFFKKIEWKKILLPILLLFPIGYIAYLIKQRINQVSLDDEKAKKIMEKDIKNKEDVSEFDKTYVNPFKEVMKQEEIQVEKEESHITDMDNHVMINPELPSVNPFVENINETTTANNTILVNQVETYEENIEKLDENESPAISLEEIKPQENLEMKDEEVNLLTYGKDEINIINEDEEDGPAISISTYEETNKDIKVQTIINDGPIIEDDENIIREKNNIEE